MFVGKLKVYNISSWGLYCSPLVSYCFHPEAGGLNVAPGIAWGKRFCIFVPWRGTSTLMDGFAINVNSLIRLATFSR